MTLQTSGAISFGNINVELGLAGTTQLSLGGAAARGLAGVASGAIRTAADFYGKSNALVSITNHSLEAGVGETFTGRAITQMSLLNTGVLQGYLTLFNEGRASYLEIDNVIVGGGTITRNFNGEWLIVGSASEYEAFFTRSTGFAGFIGGSFDTWLNLGTSRSVFVDADRDDNSDNITIQIRKVGTTTVLDSAIISLRSLAAGIN